MLIGCCLALIGCDYANSVDGRVSFVCYTGFAFLDRLVGCVVIIGDFDWLCFGLIACKFVLVRLLIRFRFGL